MLVEKLMHSPVYTVGPDVSIYDALELTRQKQIRHLPVVEAEKLVGIVSDRDLREACPSCLENCEQDIIKTTPVRKIMQTQVITVHPLDFFDEAVKLMHDNKIGCLPVVSVGRVVGIVSETDVLAHLVNMLGILAPGSYLELDIPDKPGVLAEITQIVKNHAVNISSIILCPPRDDGRKCLVLRLQALNISRIASEIEGAGYRILWPVVTGG